MHIWCMMTLSEYLKAERLSQSAFAERLGNVDRSLVSRWCAGEGGTRPTFERMLEIERVTDGKVPVASWAARKPEAA